MEIALWIWNFDAGRAQMFVDQEIQIAFESARPITHFHAPDHQLEVDRAVAEFVEKNARRRIGERGGMFAGGGNQRIAHFVDVAAISDADWNAKTHPRIAVGPVCHRRVDELGVRDDHRDVVVGHDHGAAGPNVLNLAGDAGYFDAVAHRDGPLGQNHQTADKIARDILQTKADAHADRAGKNGQRPEMNAGIIENNKNANDENDVADDLRDRVLQRTIEPALGQETIKEKPFRARRDPEDCNEKRDEQKNLKKTEIEGRQRRVPGKWYARGVDSIHGKKRDRGQTQDRGQDRNQVGVDLEPAEEAPDDVALQCAGREQADGKPNYERDDAEKRHIVTKDMEQWFLQQPEIHCR